jgi:16S rRNA (guanine1207-N2)-methyltransferase
VSRLKFRVGGEFIDIASKPGLSNWNQLSSAAYLIAEKVILPSDSRVLYLGCGNGAAGAIIAKQLTTGYLWLHDISYIAAQMTAETFSINQTANAHVLTSINLPAELENNLDAVIIELPKGRKLAQRWLAHAFKLLKTGGVLYLSGANRQGISPVVEDARTLLAEPVVLGYKKGNRLVRFQKIQQELPFVGWWQTPGIAPNTWHRFVLQIQSESIEIFSLPGIFSFDRLDPGTQLLLDSLPNLRNMNVLDLGCGYGVLGLVATRSGAAYVDMVDANLLAVAAAQTNVQRLGLANARALASDVLSAIPERKYDLIISNPPFHTGRDVDYQVAGAFIEQSFGALETGGQLYCVANRFICYEKIMELHFQSVELLVQSPSYHVLCGRK